MKNPDSKKNLSEEDKDMIVNEISLVIQNIISFFFQMLLPSSSLFLSLFVQLLTHRSSHFFFFGGEFFYHFIIGLVYTAHQWFFSFILLNDEPLIYYELIIFLL